MQAKPRRRRALVPALTAALLGVTLLVVPRLGPGSAPAIPLPSVKPGAVVLVAVPGYRLLRRC